MLQAKHNAKIEAGWGTKAKLRTLKERTKKNDQIQLIKHSNQSGAERSFHFT